MTRRDCACRRPCQASVATQYTRRMEEPDLNAFANTYLIDDGYHGAVLKFDGPPHLRKKKPHKVSPASILRDCILVYLNRNESPIRLIASDSYRCTEIQTRMSEL